MDEQRLERALRQGPPFATAYVPSSLALDAPVVRGPRVSRLVLVIAVTALLLIGMLAGLAALGALRTEEPSVELGIFEPVAGRIVYGNRQGIWAASPVARTYPLNNKVHLTSREGMPLAWSSDGTRLLVMRQSPDKAHLFVLYADGSETRVTERPMVRINGATFSPDGSRVVFAGDTSLAAGDSAVYAVDANGGPAQVLVESQTGHVEEPTFSPDGTRIAYTDGNYDHSHSVWVMAADGTDAHQILANEMINGAGHVRGLAWSPAGDRIALGFEGSTYTFASDGSGFTRLFARGDRPYWSPDGSHIAITIVCPQNPYGCGLAIEDADGSNVVTFGGAAGPWHPGTLRNGPGG